MDIKQQGIKKQWRSLITYRKFLAIGALSIPIIIISITLIINSIPPSFTHYQHYQDAIHSLRTLESQFNQEILKSRYELFTSYDPIVLNIADQKALQSQLEDTIPHFFSLHDEQDIRRILAERRAALEQKEDLSEIFKSQNAQLKNSLRYLPFLTERLEASFDASVVVPSASGQPPSNSAIASALAQDNLSTNRQPSVSRLATSIPPQELTLLRSTLNQLIRNVLLYNASADVELASSTKDLIQELADLENVLEVDPEIIPIGLFRRHAQIILTTKSYVEDYTKQLLIPLNSQAENLEAMLDQAYQQANHRAEHYRIFTTIWFLGLMGLGNLILFRQFRQANPAFERYRQKVQLLAQTASRLQQFQTTSTQPHPRPSSLARSAKTATAATSELPPTQGTLAPLLQRRDELGGLAQSLQTWENQIQTDHQLQQDESFSFLTARLSCLTQNRRRLMTNEACATIRTAFEQVLMRHGCMSLDIQFEADQVLVLFTYPATIQLAKLVKAIKTQSAVALYPMVKASDPDIHSPDDIWTEAYLIVSCASSNQPSGAIFGDRVTQTPSASFPKPQQTSGPNTTIQTIPAAAKPAAAKEEDQS